MASRKGVKLRILSKVYDKLSLNCQNPQMGLGEQYFENLIEFIIDEAEKEYIDAIKQKRRIRMKLYFCIGCRRLHYDNDYSRGDGDLIVYDHKKFFESVEEVKKRFVMLGVRE